ncbi:ArsR/SmtB family transcription factor [Mesorhizobium sp.]|uniref:ArsR/SmtB family transcription factor n=2 Tax=Phyllobacteriaceae TaxID=69277 RepID=UPI00338FF7D0
MKRQSESDRAAPARCHRQPYCLPSGELNAIVHHMENCIFSLDTAFHALADSTRRAVISRLMKGPAPVKELAEPFDMGLPAFLKHLRVLEESGLIATEKSGRVRTCRIRPKHLSEAETWLSEQRALWQAGADRLATYVENQMTEDDDE